jgi:Fic family protein
MAQRVIPWREVTPLDPINGNLRNLLESVDTLRGAWHESIDAASPEQFAEGRRRTLRRHAIETGIIEQLYEVDWGVTQALVAEGLTLDAVERVEGSISPETLEVIKSQFDALEYLQEVARGKRLLAKQLIRELHVLITKHQATYEATDQFGNKVAAQLHHGEWKQWPNHVIRSDKSLLQYTPPEQVEGQIDQLVSFYRDTERDHPIVRAAWLHHRFIGIHPFEDGNGRVARALVLLDLLRHHYAPLVVTRTDREEYIAALEEANLGELERLVRLFANLEKVALRSELHQPVELSGAVGAISVAKAHVTKIKDRRLVLDTERRQRGETLAALLHGRIREHVDKLGHDLRETFGEIDADARYSIEHSSPPDPRSLYWRHQLIRTAREVNFWANLSEGVWWVRLHLLVLRETLRYVVAIQRVGDRDVGVLAVTVFAEIPHRDDGHDEDDTRTLPTPLIRLTAADSVTLLAGQDPDDVWEEIEALIDRTASAAVDAFSGQLN